MEKNEATEKILCVWTEFEIRDWLGKMKGAGLGFDSIKVRFAAIKERVNWNFLRQSTSYRANFVAVLFEYYCHKSGGMENAVMLLAAQMNLTTANWLRTSDRNIAVLSCISLMKQNISRCVLFYFPFLFLRMLICGWQTMCFARML